MKSDDLPMPSEGALFRKFLGDAWQSLHPDIQHRFAKNPAPDRPLHYQGTLSELYCSPFGRVLGWLTRPLIGGALIPHIDANFPVDIEVFTRPGCRAIYKRRLYRLNGRQPVRFTSYMEEGPRGEVLEYVGSGLGMKLTLFVRDRNLHFASNGYFWEVFGNRMSIPAWLTPGKTLLAHCNDHENQFNIRIEIIHPWFGTMFRQVGVFHEVRDAGKC